MTNTDSRYVLRNSKDKYIDGNPELEENRENKLTGAVFMNDAKYVNNEQRRPEESAVPSRENNCALISVGKMFIVKATRSIKAGEELLLEYNTAFSNDD